MGQVLHGGIPQRGEGRKGTVQWRTSTILRWAQGVSSIDSGLTLRVPTSGMYLDIVYIDSGLTLRVPTSVCVSSRRPIVSLTGYGPRP